MSLALTIASCGLSLAGAPPVWTLTAEERVVWQAPQVIVAVVPDRSRDGLLADHAPNLFGVGSVVRHLYRMELWGERFRAIDRGPTGINAASSFRTAGRPGLLVGTRDGEVQLLRLGRNGLNWKDDAGESVTDAVVRLNGNRIVGGGLNNNFGDPTAVASLADGSGHFILTTQSGKHGVTVLHRLDHELRLVWRAEAAGRVFRPHLALHEGTGTCTVLTDRATVFDASTAALLNRWDFAEHGPGAGDSSPADGSADPVDWAMGPMAVPATLLGGRALTAYWGRRREEPAEDFAPPPAGAGPDRELNATERIAARGLRGRTRSYLVETFTYYNQPPRVHEVDEMVTAVAAFVRTPTTRVPQIWRLAGTASGKLLAFHGHDLEGEPTVLAETGSGILTMMRLPNSGLVTTHFDGTVRFWALRDEVRTGEDVAGE